MKRRKLLFAFTICAFVFTGGGWQAQAQQLEPGQKLEPTLLQWPRFVSTNGYEFSVYQPQIGKWQGNQLESRFALAVRPAGTTNETFGVIFFKARTEIDKVNRLVTLEDFEVTKADFPTQTEMQEQYVAMVRSFQPTTVKVIPLDHLEAVFAASADMAKVKVEPVRNDPPRVIYTTQPSLLVLVDGAPIFKPLTGDYQQVVNTRAVLLLNTNSVYQGNYLYAGSRWYSAPSIEGPWTVKPNVPADLNVALEAAQATKQVDLLLPENTNAPPLLLQIYVSTTPAELIETTGVANLKSIQGTELLYATNTSNAIFYCLDDANYYVLISGRWFKGVSLYGPWAFVPPGKLPADFQKIPPDHEKSNVLASVPGTPQAQEAVIANSIPQTATIERDKAKLDVNYAGEPGFAPVQGTSLQYATNTATPVVMVNPSSYYACQGGVWFVSPSPTGPWAVATSVPQSIYSIPVSSPIHYVTYSYVYGATPSSVYVGYTPGYMGTVVAPGDVVVYGSGYYYPPVVVGATYVGYPSTYGFGWGMAVGMGVGFAFGYYAGGNYGCWSQPHWGCYGWAAPYGYAYGYNYNRVNCNGTSYYTHWGTAVHPTGSYGYNAYTGAKWGSQHATTFNPYTGASGQVARGAASNPYSGNYAAGRQGTWHNPYSGASGTARAGVAGNAYSGNYAAGRRATGYNPSTGRYGAAAKGVQGNAYNGTASGTSRGVVGNANTGNKVAWNNGNVYAGKDGNVYKYSANSGAQKYSSGSWQTLSKPAATVASQPAATSSLSKSLGQSSWSSGGSSGRSTWANQGATAQATSGSRAASSPSYWANHGSTAQSSLSSQSSRNQSTAGTRTSSGQSSWANRSYSAQSTAGYKAAQAHTSAAARTSWSGYPGASSGWGGSSGGRSSSAVSSFSRESSARALGSQRFNSWQSSGGGGWGGFRGGGGGTSSFGGAARGGGGGGRGGGGRR